MRKFGIFTAACVAAAGTSAYATTTFTAADYARATAGLEAMKTTNLIVLGDATLHSDVEGKVYVGGNLAGNSATIDKGGAGAEKASALARSLTVGGNLTGGINLDNGIGLGTIDAAVGGDSGPVNVNLGAATSARLMVGGSFNAQNFNPNAAKTAVYGVSASNVQVQDQAYVTQDPSLKAGGAKDLAAGIAAGTANLATQLATLSAILGALTPNATLIGSDQNNIHFDLTGAATSGYGVADITASQLQGGTFFLPNYANTKTLIVNVAGATASLGANAAGSTGGSANIIYNFLDATALTVNTAIFGSVLAPKATLQGNSPINGSVVAKIFNSNGEVHLGTFNGQTPFLVTTPPPPIGGVPEPSSWITMLLGFGMLGSIVRRARRRERRAAA